jgi:hypothetical protein
VPVELDNLLRFLGLGFLFTFLGSRRQLWLSWSNEQ